MGLQKGSNDGASSRPCSSRPNILPGRGASQISIGLNFNAPYCKMHNLTNTNLFQCDMYSRIFTCSTQMDGFSPWTLNGGGEKHRTVIISSAERHTRLFAYKGKQLCNGRVALSAALTHLFIYSLMPRSAVSRAQRRPNRAPVNLWKGHIITDKGEREREKKKVASITKY